jgi:hypothetical protein
MALAAAVLVLTTASEAPPFAARADPPLNLVVEMSDACMCVCAHVFVCVCVHTRVLACECLCLCTSMGE